MYLCKKQEVMEDMFYFHKIRAALESSRNEERAGKMQAYMKNQFLYFGVDSPSRKTILRDLINEYGKPDSGVLMGLTGLLWADPHREMQYAAMDLNERQLKILDQPFLLFFDRLIGQKSWWDSVDWIAPKAFGELFRRYPDEKQQYIDRWMKSGNIWYIRSALLFQLHYKKSTDFDLACRLILETTGTREFFINKASGWILREYSKTDPESVRRFIDNHPELHPLTKREGLKWMDAKGV